MSNSTSQIVVVQITDIHIGPDEAPYQGIPVRDNFLKALDAARSKHPDLVVISGDLAADRAEEGAYQWVASVMKDYPFPWVIMGGNHDSVKVMEKYFDIKNDMRNGFLCFHREIKGRHIFFLDSSTDRLDLSQLQWLVQEANRIDDEVLLFIHHPPAICGCLFMDTKYPLRNIEETRSYLKQIPNIRNIFVGHYHTEKFIVQDGKNIHLTPSTFMQIDPIKPYFHMEHIRPGWRIIEWSKGRLDTDVHYALEAPAEISDNPVF